MTSRSIDLLDRLQSAERWLAADLVLRGIGAALLALGALAAWWLYRMVQRPPAHSTTIAELASGSLTVIGWACGWALLGEGRGLFRPGRPDRIDPATPRKTS